MPRKTTGTGSTRNKKTAPENFAVQPVPLQVVSDLHKNVTPISAATKKVGVSLDGINLDEEIRQRAYQLYLERNGAAGDPTQDWIVAEREVRARHASPNQSALAATQGGS